MKSESYSLAEIVDNNSDTIAAVRDRVAMWILGYLFAYGPADDQDVAASLTVGEQEDIHVSLGTLVRAGLVDKQGDNKLIATALGGQLIQVLGMPTKFGETGSRYEISCDLFTFRNVRLDRSTGRQRSDVIDELTQRAASHMVGSQGSKYGLVECKRLGDDVLYGYFAQEYLDRQLQYDENLHRKEEWNYKYWNVLFVLMFKANAVILQDSKFFGVSDLSMSKTTGRMQGLLGSIFDLVGMRKSGDVALVPLEREVTRQEMLGVLRDGKQHVSEARLDVISQLSPPERLPIFNPREDLNVVLTQIVNEYELPNVSRAVFTSTKRGSLTRSAFVRAFALAGNVGRLKVGRGKEAKVIRRKVPTHIGRVTVSDPATEEDVRNIMGFLRETLSLDIGTISDRPHDEAGQMKLTLDI